MDFDLRLILGLAALSWAMFCAAANAETSPPHPRLYFAPLDAPRLAALGYATPQYLTDACFSVTYFGDKEVVFPLPPQQPGPIENPPGFDPAFGHYPYWTGMSSQIKARLESLALSYASSGDVRYARRAVEYLLALAEWQTWSDPDYSDRTCLDTCHLTMGAAFAYDATWEAMSREERETVRQALRHLGLEPLGRDAAERAEHNLQMLRNAALGLGALAILPEEPQAWEYAKAAKEFFRWWLDLRAASPNTEGLAYTSYGLDNCLLFGAALAQAEGDREVIEHPYVARAVRWALYFWGPRSSGLVNFCDASVSHPFEVTMRVAAKYLRDPYAGYYLQQSGYLAQRSFTAAILHDPEPPIAWPPPWPPSALFRPIGWAALRSGWGDQDTLFALICSSSQEGHCHWDANHFVLNCAGEWLAADSGYKSFKGGALTEFSQGTAGHNSILIGGAGQTEKAGVISDFFTSPIFDYVVGDASRCYERQALWRFLRRVIYARPHLFFMLDELEAPQPRRFEFLLHSDRDGAYQVDRRPARPGETTARVVSLVKPTARLDVHFLEPAAPHVVFGYYPGTKEQYPPYFTVRDARPRESQRFLTVLAALRKPSAGLILELENYAPGGAGTPGCGAAPALVRLDTYGALLFRAQKPGDALRLRLPVPAPGDYHVVGHFLRSPAYGEWRVRIDGRDAGEVYRGYAADVLTYQEHDLGTMTLDAGVHEFAFCVIGKHELSSGYLVGLDDIELRPLGRPGLAAPAEPTRLRRLSGEGWVGASCVVDGARCRAYFRLSGADEIADKDLRSDAEAALLITRTGAEPQVAAYHATRVEVGGRALIQATAPINLAYAPGATCTLTLEAESAGDAALYLRGQPRRPSVPPSLARAVRYDPAGPALRIHLRPGLHTISWSLR